MKKIEFIIVFLLIPCILYAGRQTVTVMTHDSFSISKDIIREFENINSVKVRFLKSGNAAVMLNKAILSKNNPLADVMFGVDNTFLSRALKAEIFEPYSSGILKDIDENLQLDPKNRLLPVDYGDVCLNYDRMWFKRKRIEGPASLLDLIKPEYKSLLVVQNPATSSPGLAFLLSTIGRFGEERYLWFWKKLRENNVLVVDGWKNAYWNHFSAASTGTRPIVVSYSASPAAEVYFSRTQVSEAPTRAVTKNRTSFRQIEFVGILKGTKNRDIARKIVDYMLDKKFQEDIPLQMFVFPANKRAVLPLIFKKYAIIAEQTSEVSYKAIEKNREKWIREWTEAVLK